MVIKNGTVLYCIMRVDLNVPNEKVFLCYVVCFKFHKYENIRIEMNASNL